MNIEQKLLEHDEILKNLSKEMVIFVNHTKHLSHISFFLNKLEKSVEELKRDEINEKKDIEIIKVTGGTHSVKLQEHIEANNNYFDKVFKKFEIIDKDINNHLTTQAGESALIKSEISGIKENYAKKEDISKDKTNIGWLQQIIMMIIGGIVMYFFTK